MAHGGVQRGVALVAVLWMVAAVSLIVGGISASVRQEVRSATDRSAGLRAQAGGEAAIHLVMQALTAVPARPTALQRQTVRYAGFDLPVDVVPMDGLIDLAAAPDILLAALYRVAGGIPADTAAALASATVAWRAQPGVGGAPVNLEVPEDLLRVPGFSYALYASISGFVTVQRQGGGKVNAMAAPPGVLLVLASGNQAVADRIAQARARGEVGIDTTQLEQQFIGPPFSRGYRLTAQVPDGSGGRFAVTRWVEPVPAPINEAPWRVLRSERPVRLPQGT